MNQPSHKFGLGTNGSALSRFSIALLGISLGFGGGIHQLWAQEPDAPTKPDAQVGGAEDERGDEDFEQATRLRLKARSDSADDLTELINLCESALKKGLDDEDRDAAKKMIAASAFQKAQLALQQLPQARNSRTKANRLMGEAIEDLNRAVANDPSVAETYLLLAEIHANRKENTKAVESISKGIAQLQKDLSQPKGNDEDRAKRDFLVKAYLLRSALRPDIDDRLADIDLAIQSDASSQVAVRARIEVLVSLDRMDEVVTTLNAFLENDPKNVFAIVLLARTLLLQMEKPRDAIALLDSKIELLPEIGDLHRLRGQAKLRAGEVDGSMSDFNRAIELNGADVEAKLIRGSVLMQQGKLEEAKNDVDDVLQIQAGTIGALRLRAIIAAQQKRYSDAIEDLQLLVRNDPENLDYLLQLAGVYQLDERPKQALKAIDQALKQDEKNWQAMRMRGDVKLSMGEHAAAIADYEKAIRIAPKDASDRSGLTNNLAWVLATSPNDDIRDGKRAVELALEACELTEYDQPHILSTLAAAYAENGQFDQAREWAGKAVELGRKEEHHQLDQLELELKSYEENKPWREKQETKDKKAPIAPRDSGVET